MKMMKLLIKQFRNITINILIQLIQLFVYNLLNDVVVIMIVIVVAVVVIAVVEVIGIITILVKVLIPAAVVINGVVPEEVFPITVPVVFVVEEPAEVVAIPSEIMMIAVDHIMVAEVVVVAVHHIAVLVAVMVVHQIIHHIKTIKEKKI